MTKLADARINTFGNPPKADVPLSEPIFVLTSGQLQEIISRAIQPLQDRIVSLESAVASQREEIKSLNSNVKLDYDDIRDIYKHIEALRKVEPQPLQRDRGEILRALIAANGGKMLAKDARQKMHLSKSRFSELLKVCTFIETKPLHSDKRSEVIILKSKLVPRN